MIHEGFMMGLSLDRYEIFAKTGAHRNIMSQSEKPLVRSPVT